MITCLKTEKFRRALDAAAIELFLRERMQAAYRHAIDSDYRFYSYGDASLLLP